MRKVIFSLAFAVILLFLVSSVSAQITFTTQPNNVYSLRDLVSTPVQVSSSSDVSAPFSAYLICNGITTLIRQEYLSLGAGEQKNIDVLAPPVNRTMLGGDTGNCNIRAVFGTDSQTSSSFKVSNYIRINVSSTGATFNPGQQIIIQGNAVKENGQNAKGTATLDILYQNSSVYSGTTTVDNGLFYFNFSLPSDANAGTYVVKLKAYESDAGVQTNVGAASYTIHIQQIPTTLEIVFSNKSILSGQVIGIKAILHDQTGAKIDAPVDFNVTNGNGEIMDQVSKQTDTFFQMPVSYDSPPATWTVSALSDGLQIQSNFVVLRNEMAHVDFINKTLIVTNYGNVPYNKTLSVSLGDNQTLNFDVALGVGESKRYVITAPNGNYFVNVESDKGSLFSGDLTLTGNTVRVQPASEGVGSLVKYPLVWIFLIFALGFFLFVSSKKVHKKAFVGRANMSLLRKSKKEAPREEVHEKVSSGSGFLGTSNKADLSLSIKGDKQSSAVVCLNMKNFEDISSRKGNVSETVDELRGIAESSKAVVYENGNYFFFILAPIKTKTFRNEISAIKVAEKIKKVLDNHNKMFKQKIDFGLSVNFGTIVASPSGDSLKFMSLGGFSSLAKKLSNISQGEVALSKEVRERIMSEIKTEKRSEGDLDYYVLTEVRDRSKSEKFIKDFMRKMERERKDKD